MRTTILLSVGWVLLAALPAHAELRGVALYERGDYARARKVLENELRSSLLSKEERVKARLYLAAALHASGAEEAARIQLEELALTAPALKVDPILFPPDFVALAEKARETVQAQRQEAERQRLEAERQEAERRKREEAKAQANMPPVSPPAEEPQAEEESSSLQLRPELFGFIDPVNKGAGMGGAFTLGLGAVDLNARVMMGKTPGVGAEVGWLMGSGSVQPRLAVRGTAIPQLSAFGGGAVAGLRLAPLERLTFLVDVGAEYLKFSRADESQGRNFVLTSSAGVGFNLF